MTLLASLPDDDDVRDFDGCAAAGISEALELIELIDLILAVVFYHSKPTTFQVISSPTFSCESLWASITDERFDSLCTCCLQFLRRWQNLFRQENLKFAIFKKNCSKLFLSYIFFPTSTTCTTKNIFCQFLLSKSGTRSILLLPCFQRKAKVVLVVLIGHFSHLQ